MQKRQIQMKGRGRLTGVLSSCLRNTAASRRPSYSAWLWSRFLKTFCKQTEKVIRFILQTTVDTHCPLSKVFYKKDNMRKLLNWDRDAESGAWRGQDMTHAESQTILPLFRFKGDETSRCSTMCRLKDSHFTLFWVNFCPRVFSLCSPL